MPTAPRLAALPLLVTLALAAPGRAGAAERYTLDSHAAAIWNLAGTTRFEPGGGPDVVVLVERGGRDAARLDVRTSSPAGHPTLVVRYADAGRVIYPPLGFWSGSDVRLDSDGTWGHGHGFFGRHVRVSGSGGMGGLEAHADLVVQVPRGAGVTVHTVAGECTIANADGDLAFDGGASHVEVRDARGRLNVDTGSGGVDVHGFTGELLVDTGSGGVALENVHGGRVSVDTGSGGVRGGGVAAGELLVDTGSGGVRLDAVDAARVHVDTGSGGVTLGLRSRAPTLDLDTGSGHVELQVPGDFSAELDLSTSSGGIRCELPVALRSSDRGSLTGRIGDGAGRVHVDTGSGGVSIVRGH